MVNRIRRYPLCEETGFYILTHHRQIDCQEGILQEIVADFENCRPQLISLYEVSNSGQSEDYFKRFLSKEN